MKIDHVQEITLEKQCFTTGNLKKKTDFLYQAGKPPGHNNAARQT